MEFLANSLSTVLALLLSLFMSVPGVLALRQQVNVGTIDFTASQTERLDLPKELPIAALELHLAGDLNVTATNTNRDEHILNLLRGIRIRADGEDLQHWTGRSLYAYNYFMSGIAGTLRAPATATGADQLFDAFLRIPFAFEPKRLTGNPGISHMDARRFNSFTLEVDWGLLADIVSAGTSTIEATTIRVDAVILKEKHARLGIPNRLIRTAPRVATSTPADTSFQVLIAKDFQTAFTLVRASDAATGFLLSDTLVNNLGVRLGTNFNIVDTLPWLSWKAFQKRHYQLAEDYPMGALTAPNQRIEGHVMIPHIEQGHQDLFAPGQVNEFSLQANVDANTRMDIQQIRIGPAK